MFLTTETRNLFVQWTCKGSINNPLDFSSECLTKMSSRIFPTDFQKIMTRLNLRRLRLGHFSQSGTN